MTRDLARGALAGVLATGYMTWVMIAGQQAGLLRVPPPKEIAGRTAGKAGAKPQRASETFQAYWFAAHLGYGGGFGAVYALLRRILPGGPITGAAFGLALWAVSYLGYLPALGLYPPPDRDRTTRTAVTVAAHLVYGTTLDALDRDL